MITLFSFDLPFECLLQVCEEERAQHLVQLLLCLDLHSLTLEDLANMLFFSVVSDNEQAVQLLECVRAFKRKQCSKMVDSATPTVVQGNAEWVPQISLDGLMKELGNGLEAALRKPKRKLPQLPCVVGFRQTQPAQRRHKAKGSDDEDEKKSYSLASRIKNVDLTPVLFSFDPVHKKIEEELILTKLCHSPVQCSGYQVCAVGEFLYFILMAHTCCCALMGRRVKYYHGCYSTN